MLRVEPAMLLFAIQVQARFDSVAMPWLNLFREGFLVQPSGLGLVLDLSWYEDLRTCAKSLDAMDERERRANEAMDRYAAGDAAAFPVLYDALAPRLFQYLLKLARGDRARAEDLVQQTFLQMHDARGRFVAGSSVAPWAYAIARRLFLDTVRKGKRENLSGIAEELAAGMADDGPTPEADVAARRMAEELDAEIERLPANQREAFLLVRDEGLSMAEAALVLGTTVAGVKLRASRAYKALRVVLGGRDAAEEES